MCGPEPLAKGQSLGVKEGPAAGWKALLVAEGVGGQRRWLGW